MINLLNFQLETREEFHKISDRTVADESARLGMRKGEPLLIAMDAMIRYAKAYEKACESKIGDDGVLGPHYFDVISGLRGLLNGYGAVAMELELTSDSKDNSMIEGMYWQACELAGLDGNK